MIDKLAMFIAVAKEGHFGRAAASLGITQPSLSSGIKQLENELGVKLIFRGQRFGGLTPEGQNALAWARKIVGDTRQLKDEMRYRRHGLAGQLRIAAIPTALTWAAKLSARFTKLHPKVSFTILSHTSNEILEKLENLDVDAGISYLENEPMGRVTTEPLYEERYMLVCGRSSAFAGREGIGWHELGDQKLCLLTPNMQNRRIINKNFQDAGVSPFAQIESNSTTVLIAHVEFGDWLTVLPSDIAQFLSHGRDLAMVPMTGANRGQVVGLLAPYREPHTPVLAALLAEARRISKV